MSRLPRNLVTSLLGVQTIALFLVLRSALLERWPTVVMALLLWVGARAALRERTWGIGVVLATALAFPGAVFLGFAPLWFLLVGLVGIVPFALTTRPMLRFDVGATVLFSTGALGVSVAFAHAWRVAAYALFYAMHGGH